MIATPAAIRRRSSSGSIPSTAATYHISSVICPRFACSICVMAIAPLVRRRGRPNLPDDGHLDLARILHPGLDFFRQVGSQESQLIVGHLVGLGDHPDLPPGLDGVGLSDPL